MQICEIRGRKDIPTERTEHTETSCRERTPTDDTDVHRCRRVWHSCHTHVAKFCGRTAHPKYLCKSVKSVGEKIFPQNARNTQKLLAEKGLPQMSTERTETSDREEPPTDGTDEHRCRRVWHSCHTHAAKFCEFCEFCGRTAHHKYLCKSVKSVGGHLNRRFCEFGVFCGRISNSRRCGYGKMPYPPKEESAGGHPIKH